MKKLFFMFALLGAVGLTAAAEGVPWNCKDLTAAQQLAAASATTTIQHTKDRNTIMLAYLAKPADFDTFAKADAKIAELCPNLTPQDRFDKCTRLCFCQKTLRWVEAMLADPRMAGDYNFLILIGGKPSFADKTFTKDERKANLKAGLLLCSTKTSDMAASAAAAALRMYNQLTAGDDDALLVPFYKELYRQFLPKVAVNDKWKPAVVMVGLALKSRGVNVE